MNGFNAELNDEIAALVGEFGVNFVVATVQRLGCYHTGGDHWIFKNVPPVHDCPREPWDIEQPTIQLLAEFTTAKVVVALADYLSGLLDQPVTISRISLA